MHVLSIALYGLADPLKLITIVCTTSADRIDHFKNIFCFFFFYETLTININGTGSFGHILAHDSIALYIFPANVDQHQGKKNIFLPFLSISRFPLSINSDVWSQLSNFLINKFDLFISSSKFVTDRETFTIYFLVTVGKELFYSTETYWRLFINFCKLVTLYFLYPFFETVWKYLQQNIVTMALISANLTRLIISHVPQI